MDGDANGMIKCTLANWIGVAYRIPRTSLDKCKTRTDLKQTGVYFLFEYPIRPGSQLSTLARQEIARTARAF